MNFAMVDPPYIPGFLVDVLAEEKIKRSAIEQKIVDDVSGRAKKVPGVSDVSVHLIPTTLYE